MKLLQIETLIHFMCQLCHMYYLIKTFQSIVERVNGAVGRAESKPYQLLNTTQIAKFMGPPWGPPGSCRPQMGPMLAPRTLLSG